MTLGSVIETLRNEQFTSDLLNATGDLALLARIEEAGRPHGETPALYAAHAVARFSHLAGDEDWLALMNSLERSDDPATACLRHMVNWAIKSDAATDQPQGQCSCGSGHCHD